MMRLPFRRVLITGASGFVGRYLLSALEEVVGLGAEVLVVDRHDHKSRSHRLCLDLNDRPALDLAISEFVPDLVLHLAAQSSVANVDVPSETYRINVGATIELADAVRRHAPGATFFFTSSAEVYGASFNTGTVTEEVVCQPLSAYARSKLAAEYALRDICARAELRLIIVRPSNHSGAGQNERFVLPAFAAQLAAIEASPTNNTLRVGNLAAERDFMDVYDVVNAYLKLLCLPKPQHVIYNVASGRTTAIDNLLKRLRTLSNLDVNIEIDPARLRPVDIPRAALSVDRLQRETDWSVEDSLDEMLKALLASARANHSVQSDRPGSDR